MHTILSSFFLLLGDLVVLLAELFLSSKKFENRWRGGGGDNNRGRGNNSGGNKKDVDHLQEALAFFDNPSLKDDYNDAEHLESVRESVKKQFRKRSLIHHPDRNDNTPESVEMMQKINHYYTIINEELDRRQGIHHEDDDKDDGRNNETRKQEKSSNAQQQQSSQNKKTTKDSGGQSKKQAAKKARWAAREAQKELKEMERILKRQWALVLRERNRLLMTEAREEAGGHDLDTPLGRRRAHEAWQAQVQELQQEQQQKSNGVAEVPFAQASSSADSHSTTSSMRDIDDHDSNGSWDSATPPTSNESTPKKSNESKNNNNKTKQKLKQQQHTNKPKNVVMECCTNELVVALRMGLSEAAMASLSDKMQNFVRNYLVQHCREASSLHSHIYQGGQCFFTTPTNTCWLLDGDANTYLHYAVYYENGDLVDMIYSLACKFDVLPETFLRKNAHGMIPLDYYCNGGCAKKAENHHHGNHKPHSTTAHFDNDNDSSNHDINFGRKIQALTALAQARVAARVAAREAQPSWNKTARRFHGVLQNLDIISILNTMSYVLVGKIIFGTTMLVSFGIAAAAMLWCCGFVNHDDDYVAEYLFTYHIVWYIYRGLYILVRAQSWGFLFLFAVAGSGMMLSFQFRTVVRRVLSWIVLVPLDLGSWLFRTVRRRLIPIPSFVTKRRLEDLLVLFVFSIGSMGLQLYNGSQRH